MSRDADPDRFIAQLASAQSLAPCTVICGDEILLATEAGDALRAAATRLGCAERTRLVMDARGDWSAVLAATQNTSLFGDLRLLEISLPTGKPGKTGGETLQRIATLAAEGRLPDVHIVVHLPGLDRATQQSKWAQALRKAALWVDVPAIGREALPAWISSRLGRQGQDMAREALDWVTDKVEGNLLAAHQEIQKLALLYPPGRVSLEQAQAAVLNVARYNLFDLRDAMLQGRADRALSVLEGLRAEGEALLLVLWAVGEEIRILARLSEAQRAGQSIDALLRKHRLFGPRERLARQALARVPPGAWPAAVRHVQEIDCLIKGIPVPGRLSDPWDELTRLIMRIAVAGAPRP
ncbi:DNA polymerase III subunit delta [Castellaniella sp. GW247-6E4]|uniref:DNA polymerase III subunit delta n=1 Tax=Castellaniella sp. GW247-6E4 TaxID=3140380 RepID=UPI003315C933